MQCAADLSDVVRAIDRLTAGVDRLAPNSDAAAVPESPDRLARLQATGLPASVIALPGIDVVEVNAPQIYAKLCCQVCLQEWIVAIPDHKVAAYRPPRWCRWCNSSVWTNPERAQVRPEQRAKRARAQARCRDSEGAPHPSA